MSDENARGLTILFSEIGVYGIWYLVMQGFPFMQRFEVVVSAMFFIMLVVPFLAMYGYNLVKERSDVTETERQEQARGRRQLLKPSLILTVFVVVVYFLVRGVDHWELPRG